VAQVFLCKVDFYVHTKGGLDSLQNFIRLQHQNVKSIETLEEHQPGERIRIWYFSEEAFRRLAR
jgi:hypothetical protein